jgi:hypothetical protein
LRFLSISYEEFLHITLSLYFIIKSGKNIINLTPTLFSNENINPEPKVESGLFLNVTDVLTTVPAARAFTIIHTSGKTS